MPCQSPLLLLSFNRLDTIKQTLPIIALAAPPRIYLASDGARANIYDKQGISEEEKVDSVRKYLLKNISWDCEVKTRFLKENLGCGLGVSSAISWFFENEEQGIILEDDILPSVSFFRFCDELLERFKDDSRIGIISGFNHRGEWKPKECDYFFSIIAGIWGWASWRRVWEKYDFSMQYLENLKSSNYLKSLFGKVESSKIMNNFIQTKLGKIDTWDYQFSYTLRINSCMSVIPSVSLTENIGFGDEATHTFGKNPYKFHTKDIAFPLKENPLIMIDLEYLGIKNRVCDDLHYFAYRIYRFFRLVAGKIKSLLRYVLKHYIKVDINKNKSH